MRVISQDGTLDFPYELSAIRINNEVITMTMCEETAYRNVVATYSTEEKAIKAMEMLRERHTDNVFCREDIQYKAEIMLDEGLDIVREMMMKCEYFQFPKDDEVKA